MSEFAASVVWDIAIRDIYVRSLFVRVFLTFCLASALTVISLSVITGVTNARPLSHRWLMHSLDLYAKTAVDLYEQGGPGRLREFLAEIQEDSQVTAALLKGDSNLTESPVPGGAMDLLAAARIAKQSQFAFNRPWLGVVREVRGNNEYFFVAQVKRVRMFGNFVDPETTAFRAGVALLICCSLCGLLARSITKPIRCLQKTAMAIAKGDLTARVSPALAGRSDEVSLLAKDFDRMAERVQSLLDQQKLLLRDISHELRSPLARLSVSAELVQRGDVTAATRMQADIQSLEKMIADLLTLARIDASEKHPRRDRVHVGRLVQQIVKDASFEGITSNKSVVQTGVFDRSVLADSGLVHSCIENVVRNALKHTPAGGLVEVSIADSTELGVPTVAITTSDEGKGVPEEALPHIFDPFFRVTSPDSHKQGGAGLGLSISKRIAELYGGSISAENIADGGLQVRLRFPVFGPANTAQSGITPVGITRD
jgi:signal transduction histidine kinase